MQEIKAKTHNQTYSILIGDNILKILPKKISYLLPSVKKVALIFDKKVPVKFRKIIIHSLKKYQLTKFYFVANEKTKSINSVNFFLSKLLSKNLSFNWDFLIIPKVLSQPLLQLGLVLWYLKNILP